MRTSSMVDTNLFSIRNVSKFYSKSKVLDIADLKFSERQFVALLGKNGSGKSTFIRLLAQQELFEAGEILYRGTSLRSSSLRLNPQTLYLSEENDLPFNEPLSFWFHIYQKMHPQYQPAMFDQLVKQFEIDPSKNIHGMSRGQKMKALFCLEAPKRPEVYLLDEITSVLDAGSRWTLMEFLSHEVERGCLVVMSTNIADEMQGFANHVTLLEKGVVTFDCQSRSLGQHFRKLRGSKVIEHESYTRKISLNSDGSWTYLQPISAAENFTTFTTDQREITIADVQAYFTLAGRN